MGFGSDQHLPFLFRFLNNNNNNNDINNNNNMIIIIIIIIIAFKGVIRDFFLQSPLCAANCL